MIAWLLTQEPTPRWETIVIMAGCMFVGHMVGKYIDYGRYKAR